MPKWLYCLHFSSYSFKGTYSVGTYWLRLGGALSATSAAEEKTALHLYSPSSGSSQLDQKFKRIETTSEEVLDRNSYLVLEPSYGRTRYIPSKFLPVSQVPKGSFSLRHDHTSYP